MAEKVKRATFVTKEDHKLPPGAKVTKKVVRVEVQEIENGFLIEKNYDIEYSKAGKSSGTQYQYYTKKWFSKTNPLTIDMDGMELADKM